jgi:TPR repeat protein
MPDESPLSPNFNVSPNPRIGIIRPMKSSAIHSLFLSCIVSFAPLPVSTADAAADLEKIKAEAEAGDENAQYQLAGAYYRGEGVPRDDGRAAELYRKVAEHGNFKAQHNLGSMYLEGRGVKRDEAEAVKWFRMAAAQGAALAQDTLGAMLAKGRGVPKDCKEAAQWYRKAAEQDLTAAQVHLGELYYFGDDGVPQDYAAAAPWILKAAEKGNVWAQNTAGTMKEDGLGVAVNLEESVSWYRKAAEQGDSTGRFNLGRIYTVNTLGVKKDAAKAYLWLTLSKEQGGSPAEGWLNDFKKSMSASQIEEGERLLREFREQNSSSDSER